MTLWFYKLIPETKTSCSSLALWRLEVNQGTLGLDPESCAYLNIPLWQLNYSNVKGLGEVLFPLEIHEWKFSIFINMHSSPQWPANLWRVWWSCSYKIYMQLICNSTIYAIIFWHYYVLLSNWSMHSVYYIKIIWLLRCPVERISWTTKNFGYEFWGTRWNPFLVVVGDKTV